ncbi:MAG: hypothetical protein QGG65_07795 [Gammaproteobacteria bacterium]|jgi:hypothetical protein|nr:hypothetical protein [Gammaproteobacteria bacterium]
MQVSTFRHRLARAYTNFAGHGLLPGYMQMPLLTRLGLNLRALAAFCCTEEFFRLLACITIWQLVAYIFIWKFDFGLRPAALASALACLWVWPWLAAARRRHIDRLLRQRWLP